MERDLQEEIRIQYPMDYVRKKLKNEKQYHCYKRKF